MRIRDGAFILASALLLVQSGCDRGLAGQGGGFNIGSAGSREAFAAATAPGALQPFSTGRRGSEHHSLQLPA